MASSVLLVIAGLAVLTWVWTALRNQGVIGDSDDQGFGTVFVRRGPDRQESDRHPHLDALAAGLRPGLAGIALGIRAYCEVATLNAGGTLTGWNVGRPRRAGSELDPIDLPLLAPEGGGELGLDGVDDLLAGRRRRRRR